MSLLKKIGTIAANVAGIVAGVGPIASMMFPQHAGRIEDSIGVFRQLIAIIQQIEVVGAVLGEAGPAKFARATVQVGLLLKQLDLVKTHKIKDQVLFDKAVAGFAQASVDLQNSLGDKGIKLEDLHD